ncbi:hypothetical protein BDP27DRAFT_1373540 [Rhodocollybia butyracea]|uniref:Uncharacterized protein n=1 Tax=Rhodocollybia butyracea TaxID=206335 RepID=A0A9P5P5U1_9AGAR|nr:hypothetical protein BDP27DRAFT_1373540 [Rhodocollybia butyracea]
MESLPVPPNLKLGKEWPFENEKDRAIISHYNYGGFSTWSAPGADFNCMIWVARLCGIFFLADDYIHVHKKSDRISGFKRAAEAPGLEFWEASMCLSQSVSC